MEHATAKETIGVGIVGAGWRGVRTLGGRMAESARETGLRVAALCDRNPARLGEARDFLRTAFAAEGVDCSPVLCDRWEDLVALPGVDLVQVTTPQCAHREPVIGALRAGKAVYCDKPLAHTLDDAIAMVEEETRVGRPMLLGFTRRYETPWKEAFRLLKEGAIGPLHMILIRDIIPFHTFFHRWHRRMKWSGGALNDKSSHHCDVLNWFAESTPERVSAFGGRRVFREEAGAPVRCLACDRDCPYRVGPTRGRKVSQEEMDLQGDSWTRADTEFDRVDTCVFAPGADIHDHATIQVQYENGVLGVLIVSFFGPKADDQETMELVGTEGRILLNRHTGILTVVSNYGKTVETVDCKRDDFGSSHFGADLELVREMRRFHDGAPPPVSARAGYEAMRMIEAVHQAIAAGGSTIRMQDLPAARM